MKKTMVLTLAGLAICLFFALPVLYAQDAPSAIVEMDNMDGGANNLVVPFDHSAHAALGCEECHHTGEMSNCSTAGCHDVFDKADKSASSYYFVMHGDAARSTCMSCHKSADVDADRLKALKGCRNSVCHP